MQDAERLQFPSEQQTFLEWLPDETLYSLAARYSLLSGAIEPSRTSKVLFGHCRGGFPHSLPSGVAHFSSVFNKALGEPREIITHHTITPQLLVARTSRLRDLTYQAMEQGHTSTLKAKLGLLASGFGGSLPLKACRACVDLDGQSIGVGYWRVSHQLPGAWVCATHEVLLHVSMAMNSGQARYAWVLPKQDDLTNPCEAEVPLSSVEIRCLAKLAGVSRWLLVVGRERVLDAARISSLVWDRLSELDLARSGKRLRQGEAAQSFCSFFEALRKIPELERVAATPSAAYSQLLGVLNGHAEGHHPVRVASLIAWLFPDIETFAQRYESYAVVPRAHVAQGVLGRIDRREAERAKFRYLLGSGLSISASAKQVGVEVATGQAWAAAVGADVPRRASVIRDDLRIHIVERLRSGADKAATAKGFDLSISSINRVLKTEPGLHQAWKTARHQACVRRMRAKWIQVLTDFSERSKLARVAQPAVFAWLYRNDRAWLQHVSRHRQVPRSNNSAVDWALRDDQLRTQVLDAAAAISAAGQSPIRLLDLLARLPDLKRNLSNLERLPLTDRALVKALGRRRASRGRDLFD